MTRRGDSMIDATPPLRWFDMHRSFFGQQLEFGFLGSIRRDMVSNPPRGRFNMATTHPGIAPEFATVYCGGGAIASPSGIDPGERFHGEPPTIASPR